MLDYLTFSIIEDYYHLLDGGGFCEILNGARDTLYINTKVHFLAGHRFQLTRL